MKNKTLWLTETAIILALLVTLQSITKPLGQIVTGSCVNALLALSALLINLPSALIIAIFSPLLAFFLGIAPQILTVPAIMLANSVYVILLTLFSDKSGKNLLKQTIACILSAAAKFAVLYTIVVLLICGLLSDNLLASGTLKPAMLQALPVTFSWPQLITALIGSAVALTIVPILKKALHK